MIDLRSERAVTLAAATRLPELSRNGRKPHIASLFRWAAHGVRGVKLETVQLAGSKVTTREAVARFLSQLTTGSPAPSIDAQEDAEAAEKELASAGF